jgi:hypothetical protein
VIILAVDSWCKLWGSRKNLQVSKGGLSASFCYMNPRSVSASVKFLNDMETMKAVNTTPTELPLSCTGVPMDTLVVMAWSKIIRWIVLKISPWCWSLHRNIR